MKPLHEAAAAGNLDRIRQLLADRSTDINEAIADGTTALFMSAQNGHGEVVQALLGDERIDPTRVKQNGGTALHTAAQTGHEGVVKILLADGRIDPNARALTGVTALYLAAQNGHDKAVQALLADQRTDPNRQTQHGATPLIASAEKDYLAVVQALLAHERIVPDRAQLNGGTAVYVAAKHGRDVILKTLLADGRIDPNLQAEDWNAMQAAAAQGYERAVHALLADGRIDPDRPNKEGWAALLLAAAQGKEEVVRALLTDDRVNPNLQTQTGATALYLAAQNGHLGVVRTLLADARIIPGRPARDGSTPLLIAAQGDRTAIVKLLLADRRIDPNQGREDGSTALHLAATKGREGPVRALLSDQRTDPNRARNDGMTPLHMTAFWAQSTAMEALLEHPNIELNRKTPIGVTALDGAVHGVLTNPDRRAEHIRQLLDKQGKCGEGYMEGLFDVPISPDGRFAHRFSASLLRALAFADRLTDFNVEAFEQAKQLDSQVGAANLARALDAFSVIRPGDARPPFRRAMRDLCRNGGLADTVTGLLSNPAACKGLMQIAEETPPGACGNNPAYEAFRLINASPCITALSAGDVDAALNEGRHFFAAEHVCENVVKRIDQLNRPSDLSWWQRLWDGMWHGHFAGPLVGQGTDAEYVNRIAAEVQQRAPGAVRAALSDPALVPFGDHVRAACARHRGHNAFCDELAAEARAIAQDPDLRLAQRFLEDHVRVGSVWREGVMARADALFLPIGADRQQALNADEPPLIPSVILDRLADPQGKWQAYEEDGAHLSSREAQELGERVKIRRVELRQSLVRDLGTAASSGALSDSPAGRELVAEKLALLQQDLPSHERLHPVCLRLEAEGKRPMQEAQVSSVRKAVPDPDAERPAKRPRMSGPVVRRAPAAPSIS